MLNLKLIYECTLSQETLKMPHFRTQLLRASHFPGEDCPWDCGVEPGVQDAGRGHHVHASHGIHDGSHGTGEEKDKRLRELILGFLWVLSL